MEEPIPIFENKFITYVQQLDNDCKVIENNLKMIADGKVRAGHFNEISEKITTMHQTATAIKHLDIKKEAIGLEINKRLGNILTIAIDLSKKEADKDPNDPLGIHEDPYKIK